MTRRRVCVIGNSHVACIKLATDALGPAHPEIDFFAVSANRMSRLRLADGKLRLGNAWAMRQFRTVAGGREAIDLRDYDAFAFVGISFEYRDFLRVFRTHCLYRHRQWLAGRALIGDDAFRAFQNRLYGYRPAYRLAREIATVRPDAALLMVASPYPVDTFLGTEAYGHMRPLVETPYFREIAALYETAAAAAARSVGGALSVQPPETLAAPAFTAPKFNRQPVGLVPTVEAKGTDVSWFAEKKGVDPWHMNAEFGRLRLADIAAAFGAAVPEPAGVS